MNFRVQLYKDYFLCPINVFFLDKSIVNFFVVPARSPNKTIPSHYAININWKNQHEIAVYPKN